jgi:hypothetical protein
MISLNNAALLTGPCGVRVIRYCCNFRSVESKIVFRFCIRNF